jgi:iron complex outermembrane receptor protein
MKIQSRRNRARRVGLTLLSLPLCGLVQAQQAAVAPAAEKSDAAKDSTTLETVTITATRRAEPLQKASTSATVLSGDDLIKAGISAVEQIQFATPSAAANNFGQGLNITIRGIGKAETNTQTTTGVITYRDGVATFPGYFTAEPYYDIATVQILRGPQGTFGGQNATGGAVLVESNDPVIKGGHHGYIAGQLGNYKDVAAQGAVNMPISDTLAARFAFNSERRDSFWTITGPYTGSDGRLRSYSGRLGLLWQPVKALSVLFKTDYNHLDMGAYPADPVGSTNDPFVITANGDQQALDRFKRSLLKVEYKFDDGTKFRSITARQRGNTIYSADLDGTSVGNWGFRDSVDELAYSQEFNLVSPDEGRLSWILGAYAQRDTYTFPPGQFVIGVPYGQPASEYQLSGKNPKRTWAVFGQLGYLISSDLKAIFEGRYSESRTSNDIAVVQYGTALSQQQSAEFENFSGKVALNWTLSDRHFLYGFVATAFRPGGLNVPVGLGLPAPFKEEKVRSTELGWKASWMGGRVQTQLAAFYNDYRNFQVTIGYPNFPTFGIELNTPNPTRIYGAEAQLQARLEDGWSVRANLGWLHSSLGQFYANDPRQRSTAACDPIKGPASASCVNLEGHEQTYAPRLTYNVSLERRFMVGDHVLTPRVNIAHIASQWATLFQNQARGDLLASRNIVAASVDWEHGDLLGSLYSTNLTNQHYIAAIGSGLRWAGAPRQYGVRLTKFF